MKRQEKSGRQDPPAGDASRDGVRPKVNYGQGSGVRESKKNAPPSSNQPLGGRYWSAEAIFALVVLTGCRGPGGPMERAGRSVDNAVYDVGRGVKKAGEKIQEAAE